MRRLYVNSTIISPMMARVDSRLSPLVASLHRVIAFNGSKHLSALSVTALTSTARSLSAVSPSQMYW